MIKLLKPEEFASARTLLDGLEIERDVKAKLLALLSACEANNVAMANKLVSVGRLQNLVFGKRTESLSGTLFSDAELVLDKHDSVEPELALAPDVAKTRRSGRRNLKLHAHTEVIRCSCNELSHGNTCPSCRRGNVHADRPLQKTVIQCVNLVVTQVYEIETLRCRSCGHTESAESPAVVNECIGKYHFSAIAHLALLRYHAGLPSHRMQDLTGMLGLSVPESTQFRLFEEAAKRLRYFLMQIKNSIANCDVTFRDDSPMRIMELDTEANSRKSVTVTTLVGLQGSKKFILYETSTRHAGEVFGKIMSRRAANAPPPLAMSDSLSANHAHNVTHIRTLACLVHARRNFFELVEHEPEETRLPLELVAQVYANESKFKGLPPADRLVQHQRHSGPLMAKLLDFSQRGTYRRGKNEDITKAFAYVVKHWERLTGFLKFEGAPLDNNEAERTLKRAIRHRRNSLFYRTEHGAAVGDVLMSIIATVIANGLNPIAFLTEALKNPPLPSANASLFQI